MPHPATPAQRPPRLRRTWAVASATLALLSAALPAQAGWTSLYVFGDSLSDAGGGSALPLAPNEGGFPIPAPYTGGRVTNGPVAAEYLATLLGLSDANTYHFAVAGARSGADGTVPGVGVASQINAFRTSGLAAGIDSGSLFMVWSGANDLRDALALGAGAGSRIPGILGQISQNIQDLYGLGARSFLLPNAPDLGLTPAAFRTDLALPGASAGATALSMGFNGAMMAGLSALELSLPGADFRFADAFSAQRAVVANAASLGLSNLRNGCLVPLAGLPVNTDCSQSFFVDDIHPTTQVHQILGNVLYNAVPEPGSLLLAGAAVLGLMGASARRRRDAAAV